MESTDSINRQKMESRRYNIVNLFYIRKETLQASNRKIRDVAKFLSE